MKKSFLMLGLAVAAMSSCTNDEVIDMNQSNQKAIGFESFVNKGTRADIDDNNPLKEFYVFGFYGEGTSVFSNDIVYKININEAPYYDWKIDAVKNWDTQYYYFAAYANGQGTGTVETSDGDKLTNVYYSYNNSSAVLEFRGYEIAENFENQKDLIATQTHRDNKLSFNQGEVNLNFTHMLSKVSFKFHNNSDENLDMVISDVKLNVYNKATCTYTYNSNSSNIVWNSFANTNGFSEYSITFDTSNKSSKIVRTQSTAAVGTSYVIPQQTTPTISFKVEYFDKNGNSVEGPTDKELSLLPNSLSWENSNVYNYIIYLPASPNQINFNVSSVGPWTINNDITIDGSSN